MNEAVERIVHNVEQVIVGKRYAIELVLMTLLCRGHILIEDVPGVGKTSLASAVARSADCSFRRVQFTPDIMPSDITGFTVYNPKTGAFDYKPGVIMSQFILADEINRTAPKTQSSLLEVMEENHVTVDGVTYDVPQPFMVLATQNPVEYLGTYPLPEAQLDRFFMRVSLGYPAAADEVLMLNRLKTDEHRLEGDHRPAGDHHKGHSPLTRLKAITTAEEISVLQNLVETIHVENSISRYIVGLVRATRELPEVLLGGSPRASICLYKASQAWALYNSRDYVVPDDVKQMAMHVLEHRIILTQEAKLKKITAPSVIEKALDRVKLSENGD